MLHNRIGLAVADRERNTDKQSMKLLYTADKSWESVHRKSICWNQVNGFTSKIESTLKRRRCFSSTTSIEFDVLSFVYFAFCKPVQG